MVVQKRCSSGNPKRHYLCIDLKSFYASAECAERGLDPMQTRLVVADPERSRGTICLAVSPALKKLGVPNRCRLFQVPPGIDFITAPPRMQLYIDYAARIYEIYLRYLSADDIFVYSIDEAFLDVTGYLPLYGLSARELAQRLLSEIAHTLRLPAACGIGSNLYLAKIALDILAKHSPDSVAALNEADYREKLWTHRPLTDFWRIGPGTARRLESAGMRCMRDVAAADPALLRKLFGIDSEILIDHAFGREPTEISDIKAYVPKARSLCSGQVLMRDYDFEEALLVLREMTDQLALELTAKTLSASSISLCVGYAKNTLPAASGSQQLSSAQSSGRILMREAECLFRRIVSPAVPVRRMTLSLQGLSEDSFSQCELFTDPAVLSKDREMQRAVLSLKKRFGKNAVLKGMDLMKAATAMERNRQIGGHRA